MLVYPVTDEQFLSLYSAQGGMCKICEDWFQPDRKLLHVDHCHETGYVRGLLCKRCNFGLGWFRDSPKLLGEAMSYLQCFRDRVLDDEPIEYPVDAKKREVHERMTKRTAAEAEASEAGWAAFFERIRTRGRKGRVLASEAIPLDSNQAPMTNPTH